MELAVKRGLGDFFVHWSPMDYDLTDQNFEIEIPTLEIIQINELITYLNDNSLEIIIDISRPGFSKWQFEGGKIFEAIMIIQRFRYQGDEMFFHFTCDKLKASYIRSGIYLDPSYN